MKEKQDNRLLGMPCNPNSPRQMKKNRFNIDFFEFSFLVEACIPPRPIARAMFWDEVINKHYHVLRKEERANLFKWITKNPCFDKNNEDCMLFYNRYNPDNQYLVHTFYEDIKQVHECFYFKDLYYKSKGVSVSTEYITSIEKVIYTRTP